jgi:hypothetical protein
VRSVVEENCIYTFEIYTKSACNFIAPSSVAVIAGGYDYEDEDVTSSPISLIAILYDIYTSIFYFILWVLYYCLVIFVIYNIYVVIKHKVDNPHSELSSGVPYKDRIVYYYNRVKSCVIKS